MLSDEVVEAVEAGRFHLWSVSDVDQGIEILTGVPAGKPAGDGTYPEGSVNFLVNEKLGAMVESLRRFSRSGEKGERKSDLPGGGDSI
jgi:hypothetical protein